jgi:hypothetical protein
MTRKRAAASESAEERAAAETELPAAEAAPAEAAGAPVEMTHAARVRGREPGQEGEEVEKLRAQNPFPWKHDNLAGVELRTNRETLKAELAFRAKPPQEVIDLMHANSFSWNGAQKIWTLPIRRATEAQDRLVALRAYQQAVDMIREAKGLEPSRDTGAPF